MANRKVRHVRFYQAVQIGGSVFTGLDSEKHKLSMAKPMEVVPPGAVHFIYKDTHGAEYEKLIPFSNIHDLTLVPELVK